MTALAHIVLLAASAATFDSTYRAGLRALNNNELAVAQTQLEAASKLQPRNAQVWLALAQAYFKQNKTALADSAALKAETLGANEPMILHALAFYYTESRKPAKAASLEARYAEKNPQDEDAYPRAIDLYLRADQPKPAVDTALKALAKSNTAGLHLSLAKSYDASGQFEKAVAEYRQALKLRPYEEVYYFELSQAYLHKQRFADSLEVLNTAKSRFDKSAQIELALGVTYYGLRRFPEAIDQFLRTTQLSPDVEQPYIFLGRMLELAGGKLREVTGAMGTFASAKPNNFMSSFLYAKALAAEQADPEQLEPLLRRSIALNPNYWESHFELGSALERKKDFAGAASEYEKSTRMNPKEAAPHYRLARVYDRLGKPQQAAAERAAHAKLSEQEKSGLK